MHNNFLDHLKHLMFDFLYTLHKSGKFETGYSLAPQLAAWVYDMNPDYTCYQGFETYKDEISLFYSADEALYKETLSDYFILSDVLTDKSTLLNFKIVLYREMVLRSLVWVLAHLITDIDMIVPFQVDQPKLRNMLLGLDYLDTWRNVENYEYISSYDSNHFQNLLNSKINA